MPNMFGGDQHDPEYDPVGHSERKRKCETMQYVYMKPSPQGVRFHLGVTQDPIGKELEGAYMLPCLLAGSYVQVLHAMFSMWQAGVHGNYLMEHWDEVFQTVNRFAPSFGSTKTLTLYRVPTKGPFDDLLDKL